ncbi:MAG: transposase [Myxococcota bacterium]|jgi:transposase
MGRTMFVATHDTIEELQAEYKRRIAPGDRVYRDHLQVVWLMKMEGNATKVAKMMAMTRKWTGEIIKRYNADGIAGLGDGRHNNPGAEPLLSPSQWAALADAVAHDPPPGGGRWSGPKVAFWASQTLGRPVIPQQGWRWMKKLGKSFRQPRPTNADADEEEQDRFIHEELPAQIEALQQAHPEAELHVYAQDEHRVGLKPVLRRAWLDKGGSEPIPTRHGYKWLWVSGFVCPESGANHWWLTSHLNTKVFSATRAAFAKEAGAAPHRQIAVVLDIAGFHRGGELKLPEHVHLIWLPSKSPELQPAERLWPLLDEAIMNCLIEQINQVGERVAQRCRELYQQTALVSAYTLFHWWPRTISTAY